MNKEEAQKLVLARLESAPDTVQFHRGNGKSMDKDELIKHVKDQDEIGQQFVEMQMEYIKASMKGFL